MSLRPARPILLLTLCLLAAIVGVVGHAARAAGPPAGPLRVVGLADLKGKTSPCGCSTPKGGLARIASFLDSLRATPGPVLVVDAGGSFPDVAGRPDLPPFVYGSFARLGVDAVGVAPRDLQFGVAFLLAEARRAGTPLVCANLVLRANGRLVTPPSLLLERGGVRIGVFALVGDRFDLGPARDSLQVLDPENTAQRMVADLRGRGAERVVLLAQLGRVGAEDVASAVPGLDAVIVGHDAPLYPRGREAGDALLSYAGDQGQHLGLLRFGSTEQDSSARAAEVITMGPEVRNQAAMLEAVRRFEDDYNDRMRVEQRRMQALADADPDQDPVDHFVGGDVCARCHAAEAAQWATTGHSVAWETLVRERKDSTPECIPCHSVGYRQPGGFRDAARTPHLVNVQCENCHGMGTLHDRQGEARTPVGEETCRGCHNAERHPGFDYARSIVQIVHSNSSGESLRAIQERRRKGDYDAGH
jgi:hypothetical protein